MTQIKYPLALSIELNEKFDRRLGYPITFDGEYSLSKPLVDFVNIRHPLALCAIEFFTNNTNQNRTKSIAKLLTTKTNGFEGDFLFFIYLLQSTDADSQTSLLPIVLNLDGSRNQSIESFIMITIITESDNFSGDLINIDWDQMQQKSLDYFVIEQEKVQKRIETTNSARINSRIASLKQTYSVKIARLNTILNNLRNNQEDSRIIRLREGQIRNLQSKLTLRVDELNAQHGVSVGGDLKLMGTISFRNNH